MWILSWQAGFLQQEGEPFEELLLSLRFIAKWKCSLCLWHELRFVNFVNQRNTEFIFQSTWNLVVDFWVHRAVALTQHSSALKLPNDPCTHFLVYSLFCQRACSWKIEREHSFQIVLRVIVLFCGESTWWDR